MDGEGKVEEVGAATHLILHNILCIVMCKYVVEEIMSKRVIQVPVDEQLLMGLDTLSRKRRKTRSEVIRQACVRYIREVEQEEMDSRYQAGYRKTPEAPETGEAQVAVSGEVLAKEDW